MKDSMRFSSTAQDCFFLSLVVLLSLVLYVWGLGFYSDDWIFLEYLSTSADQSLSGLFQLLMRNPHEWMRPAQLPYLWSWKLLSILSLLSSILAYEVVLPLFLFNLVLVWYRGRQLYGAIVEKYLRPANLVALLGINLLAIFAATVFKLLTTV